MDSATPCATQIRGVCVGGVRRGWNLLSSHRRNTDLLTALRHSLTASLRLVCARALYLYSFVIRDSPRARWGWGRLGCVGTLELSALWTDWSVGLEGQRRVQGAGTGTRCAPRRAHYSHGDIYTCAAPATTRPIRSRTRRELRGNIAARRSRAPHTGHRSTRIKHPTDADGTPETSWHC